MSCSVFAYGLEIGGVIGSPTVANSVMMTMPITDQLTLAGGIGSISGSSAVNASALILKGTYELARSGSVSSHAGLSVLSVTDDTTGVYTPLGSGLTSFSVITGLFGVDIAIAEGFTLVLDTEVLVAASGTGGYTRTTILGNPSIGFRVDLP